MILRYSRITEYFVSVSTCSSRLSSNWRQFLFNYRLAFSFFFILVLPLYLSSFCVLSIPKWFSTCLFPFYPTYECVSFEMYTLHPFPPPSSFRHSFSISHISSLLRFIFPLLLVSVRFFYIYIRVWISWSQPYFCLANEADIFERKNLCQKSSERSCHCRIRLFFEDALLFYGIRD